MGRIRLSNLFHSVGAAKLKDLSKNVLEQFLLSDGITNNKSSLAELVFVELLFLFTKQYCIYFLSSDSYFLCFSLWNDNGNVFILHSHNLKGTM